MPFVPLPNADDSDALSERYFDVFTTETENSTMNSTSSSVSMSAYVTSQRSLPSSPSW